MSNFTNELEQQVLEYCFQNQDLSASTTVEVALHTGPPGEDADQNEVSGSSYAREETTAPDDWNIDTANTVAENTVRIEFEQATEDWGDVSHLSLWDGTDPFYQGELEVSRTILEGDTFRFNENQLTIDLD